MRAWSAEERELGASKSSPSISKPDFGRTMALMPKPRKRMANVVAAMRRKLDCEGAGGREGDMVYFFGF